MPQVSPTRIGVNLSAKIPKLLLVPPRNQQHLEIRQVACHEYVVSAPRYFARDALITGFSTKKHVIHLRATLTQLVEHIVGKNNDKYFQVSMTRFSLVQAEHAC